MSRGWTMRAIYRSHQPLFALFSSWRASAEHPSAWGVCHHHMGSQLLVEAEPCAPIHPPQQCHSHLACCAVQSRAAHPSPLTGMELLGGSGRAHLLGLAHPQGKASPLECLKGPSDAASCLWLGHRNCRKGILTVMEGRISVTVLDASRHAALQALDVTVNAFSTMYHIHDCEYIVKKKKKKGLYGVLLLEGPEV